MEQTKLLTKKLVQKMDLGKKLSKRERQNINKQIVLESEIQVEINKLEHKITLSLLKLTDDEHFALCRMTSYLKSTVVIEDDEISW